MATKKVNCESVTTTQSAVVSSPAKKHYMMQMQLKYIYEKNAEVHFGHELINCEF
jgi:hypothetical protein